MRIIHCADLHLDSAMTTHLSADKTKERKNELLLTFLRMLDYAEENAVKAIIIAGDLFDKKSVSKHARETVFQAIVSHPELNFYYLRGNHDTASFVPQEDSTPDNLKTFGTDWTKYVLFESGQGAITLSGVELNSTNKDHIYDSLFLSPNNFNIVTIHGQLAKYKTKNDAEIISLKELANKHINYLALGHVHEYQEGELSPNGVYCYPGCLEGRGFDESGKHGFVLLDIDEKSFKMQREFVPFAFREIESIEVDVTGCMTTTEMMEQVEEMLSGTEHTNNLTKINLVGQLDVDCERDLDLIRQKFQNQFYVLCVEDSTSLKIDYKQFEYDQSLRGEFVRLLQQEDSLSDEEKAQIIRCGLQVLSGEEIEI